MKVGWSSTHGEFLISDYYYFSKLYEYCIEEGLKVEVVDYFSKLKDYDIIVFNYPEIFFKLREISRIRGWLREGKKLVFTSYYSNLDRVTDVINRVLAKLQSGIEIKKDAVIAEEKYHKDPMFPIAQWKNREVVMPCCSSVSGGEVVLKSKNAVLGARKEIYSGDILVLGTCVFWDNYSIDLYSNREFAISILSGDF